VTTRGGKSTHDPPNPNQSSGKANGRQEAEPSTTQKEKEKELEEEMAPKDFVDTNYLPFFYKEPQVGCRRAIRLFC